MESNYIVGVLYSACTSSAEDKEDKRKQQFIAEVMKRTGFVEYAIDVYKDFLKRILDRAVLVANARDSMRISYSSLSLAIELEGRHTSSMVAVGFSDKDEHDNTEEEDEEFEPSSDESTDDSVIGPVSIDPACNSDNSNSGFSTGTNEDSSSSDSSHTINCFLSEQHEHYLEPSPSQCDQCPFLRIFHSICELEISIGALDMLEQFINDQFQLSFHDPANSVLIRRGISLRSTYQFAIQEELKTDLQTRLIAQQTETATQSSTAPETIGSISGRSFHDLLLQEQSQTAVLISSLEKILHYFEAHQSRCENMNVNRGSRSPIAASSTAPSPASQRMQSSFATPFQGDDISFEGADVGDTAFNAMTWTMLISRLKHSESSVVDLEQALGEERQKRKYYQAKLATVRSLAAQLVSHSSDTHAALGSLEEAKTLGPLSERIAMDRTDSIHRKLRPSIFSSGGDTIVPSVSYSSGGSGIRGNDREFDIVGDVVSRPPSFPFDESRDNGESEENKENILRKRARSSVDVSSRRSILHDSVARNPDL